MYPITPNIAITYLCNRRNRCTYCYAMQSEPHMKTADFKAVIRWARILGARCVYLVGGEPTMHPRFAELANIAKKNGVRIQVFTNGLFGQKVRDRIASDDNIERIHFHYEKVGLGDAENRLFFSNLGYISKKKRQLSGPAKRVSGASGGLFPEIGTVVLRYTAYQSFSPEQLEPLLPFVDSVAFSWIEGPGAPPLQSTDFQKLMKLDSMAGRHGMPVVLIRPVDARCLTAKERKKVGNSIWFRTTCAPITKLTINPDLSVQMCPALFMTRTKRLRSDTEFKAAYQRLRRLARTSPCAKGFGCWASQKMGANRICNQP